MDRRLRQLERQWLISRDPRDQRRFLRARSRSATGDEDHLRELFALGLLSRERLSLAAHLGHPPARAALDLPLQRGPVHDPGSWLEPLADLGQPALIQVLGAVIDAWTTLWVDVSECQVKS